jgi:nicotinate-nucleotide adenylyltransferase
LIAFFGGTFDPVHLGHLHAARTVATLLACNSIHLVLAPHPALRDPPVASVEHRWRMLQIAVEGDAVCVADDRELRRAAPSYTVETLEQIRAEFGSEAALAWCIGTDQYAALDRWRDPDRILALAHLVVLYRGDHAREVHTRFSARVTDDPTMLRNGAGRIYRCPAPMLPISATAVRRALAHGEPVGGLLPPKVSTYITQHRLYGGSGDP